MTMSMAAVDFGRLFFHAVTVANAASAGAIFGARDNIKAGDFDGIRDSALADAANVVKVSTVTATAGQLCACSDGTEISCKEILVTTCSGGDAPRAYVKSQVANKFEVLGPYPGIPRTTDIGRTVWIRVE